LSRTGDLVDPDLAGVIDLLRAARSQTAREHREDQRLEQRTIASSTGS